MAASDPVCGMPVDDSSHLVAEWDARSYRFCSARCRDRFVASPAEFVSRDVAEAPRRIAYFSMEVALDAAIPTYSGGLGILAGDMLRSCADLRLPVVGVTLVYRRGYFRQELGADGRQRELPVEWRPDRHARALPDAVTVEIEGRRVAVRGWHYDLVGSGGFRVPVYLLDTDVPENSQWDRRITDCLYGGDAWYRLAQEIVLGIGGLRLLRAAGHDRLHKVHLNEGHAAFAAWELARDEADEGRAIARARQKCVFTTHTPVEAGHDRFDWADVSRMLGAGERYEMLKMLAGSNALDMTRLALNLSGFANGVAIRHQEVTEQMFPGYAIHHVTNGVHSATWTCPSVQRALDAHVPGWASDPSLLRHALALDGDELWRAHQEAKRELCRLTAQLRQPMAEDVFTIGFARRAATYKRADLLFADPGRLVALAKACGGLQLVFGGKAHPHDEPGKEMIRRVFARARELGASIRFIWIPDYDLRVARTIVSGVDVWLNTPAPPMEASGTSGMKAAHNGVPSLSTRDGWWVEGHIEGVTGWSLADANELYEKLERRILPAFADRAAWTTIMKHCIALNASFFNTHRMVQQYAAGAYLTA